MRTFEISRPTVGAQALGIARAAYEYALDYAKDRVAFGRPIIENQAIAFALADMRTEIDAARLLVWRASWMGRTNQPFTAAEGSMSKLKAGEVAVAVTDKAVQILGGAGYVTDHPVERWSRDAKIYTIFEGTSEIQRLVIARAISGVPHPLTPTRTALHRREARVRGISTRRKATFGRPGDVERPVPATGNWPLDSLTPAHCGLSTVEGRGAQGSAGGLRARRRG